MLDKIAVLLRCPRCQGTLERRGGELVCAGDGCARTYPVVGDIPVLLDDEKSLFRASEVAAALRGVSARRNDARSVGSVVRSLTPSISRNLRVDENLARLSRLLPSGARVLIIGYAAAGDGSSFAGSDDVTLVARTSVFPDVDATLIADPLGLPFEDAAFDAVVARDVLHKVVDPWRCTAEMHRVLKPSGLVYAETPFVQPIRDGAHDFYRFTHLGHRYAFRRFEEIASGAASGPGEAAAWSWRYLLWSFGRGSRSSMVLRTLADFTSFFGKGFDRVLIDRPRALDAASSVYFLGRRSEVAVSDRELVFGYRGAELEPEWLAGASRSSNEKFSQWAATGRDEQMARNHAPAVTEMLDAAFAARGVAEHFSLVDAGCGNGWVVRLARDRQNCRAATGVDHSAAMIAKARAIDPDGDYVLANLLEWEPRQRVDLVHSMEVLYYFEDPLSFLKLVRTRWLRVGGWAVIGIDHYQENAASLAWPRALGVRMTTWPESQWRAAMEEAGFTRLRTWRAAASSDSTGTLVMLGCAQQSGQRST
ncbi:MAG: methyltransferase domain-containing protein [Betaproteobacteria bacterium]